MFYTNFTRTVKAAHTSDWLVTTTIVHYPAGSLPLKNGGQFLKFLFFENFQFFITALMLYCCIILLVLLQLDQYEK